MYLGTLFVTFTHFLKILCYSVISEKKKPFKRALWNKNVLTSHKIRSLLDSQFTTSPYFIFLKTISKLLSFSFMPTPVYFFAPYLLESLWPCSLRKNKLSCFLFWNLTFGAPDTTIPAPFLPSLETPVSAAGLLVFTHWAPLGLALCISWLMVLSSWSRPYDYHGSSSC